MELDNYIFIKEHRNKLYIRGLAEDKTPIDGVYDFKPTYFIKTKEAPDAISIYGDPLKAKTFESIKEANRWKRELPDSVEVYGDIKHEVMCINTLPKKNIVSIDDVTVLYYDIETTMSQAGIDVFNTPEEIIAITAFDTKTKRIHVFASKSYKISESAYEGYEVTHHIHTSEFDMLADFVNYWQEVNPHIISGWNIDGFDNPYIYNRIKRVLGESVVNKLSPWGIINTKQSETQYGRPNLDVEFFGITSFDYLPIYKKNTFTPIENYKLDTVVKKELGDSKLDYSFAKNFVDFYTNHWDKFIEYNIIDTILVHKLEEKLGLIALMMEVAYTCGCPYQFANGTTQKLDSLIYNYANKINKVIPPHPKDAKKAHYEGAYVVDPEPGLYEGVVSYDLTSLYPSIIRQFNISPETRVKNLSEAPKEIIDLSLKYNPDDIANLKVDTSALNGTPYTIAINGSIYNQEIDGILKTATTNLFFDRKKYKKLSFEYWEKASKTTDEEKKKYLDLSAYYDRKQMVMKLLINSIYGAMGTPYFRYYDLYNALAITKSGQAVIKFIQREVNEYLNKALNKTGERKNYLVYGDTDSSYFYLPELIELAKAKNLTYDQTFEVLKGFADGALQDFISNAYKKFSEDYLNCKENLMHMDREVLSVRGGVFVAKKKYFIAVDDMEGKRFSEQEPYWKITGMEAIKAGKYPEHIRNELKEIIKLIVLKRDESVVQEYIKDLKTRFWGWDPDDIAFNSAVNNIEKFITPSGLKKGTPITVRAAYTFNEYIKKNGIIADPITNGEKIKYLYLREPNDAMSNVIGYKEFNTIEALCDKIDIKAHWEKNMLSPIKTMLDALGWAPEKQNTLF